LKIGFLSHLDLNLYLFRLPIMKALADRGHTVYAICPRGGVFEKFDEHGVQAIDYKIDRGSLNPFKELMAIYAIYQALIPLHLDLLHTFTAKPNIYGTIAGRLAKIPTILNLVEGLGSFYVEEDLKSRTMRRIIESAYRLVFARSQGVVFVNSDDPTYLREQGVIVSDAVHIIKSVGIDTERFSMEQVGTVVIDALRRELGLADKVVVLMVARAIWHKGIREFYEAARVLKREDIRFLLVGDTDEGNPSCAPADFLQGPNVAWLGHRDDIKELIALCDVFVLPSYREGVPRTLLEASAMSKAMVTTDTVGCREVVEDGVNGLLVPVRDVGALASAIARLVDDPLLRSRLAENARSKAVKEFDIRPITREYLDLYAEFIDV